MFQNEQRKITIGHILLSCWIFFHTLRKTGIKISDCKILAKMSYKPGPNEGCIITATVYHEYQFMQGFMQAQFIASHTCFGRHMDVNC